MSPETLSQNRRAWDERVRRGKWYVDTATEQDFRDPLRVIDPCGWLGGSVQGKRVLCLAAGGARHSVLFAAAGAKVTVVDLSSAMLDLDRRVAAARELAIEVVESSMTELGMFADAVFEIVIQPVSTCYVPDVLSVYREVARVTAPDGLYISQHKQPASMQAEWHSACRGYLLAVPYFHTGPLPPAPAQSWHREAGTIEFLHPWEVLLGGLCKSGFVIESIGEPKHGKDQAEPGSFPHRSWFVPPYIKIKARRTGERAQPQTTLWTPGSRAQ